MKQTWKNLSLVIVMVALVLVGVVPVSAQEETPYTISVVGYGVAHGTPNVAYLQLGVNMAGDAVADVVANVNETIAEVRRVLVELGIAKEDMQTANFNLWSEERFDDSGAPTGERFYRAENMLRIVVRDVTKLDEVIETGLDAGATTLFGLSFGIDDATALEQEARLNAIADAKDRAQKLADALGLTLGEPLIVREGADGMIPAAYQASSIGYGGGGGMVIEEGEFTVSLSVYITFAVQKGE
ncbi:MAG: SIMPL domain-containing protein [Anaerolineae bacterium]|nr:SIMPL domain-containing protein [Anaerolineae bacterium]